jgi:hypothetical protein
MNFKRIASISLLVLTSFVSQAETLTFETTNSLLGYNSVYPSLDLNGNTEIKLRIEQKNIEGTPEFESAVTKAEFKFEHANDLTVYNFSKVAGTHDLYRAIVTSPWVFKKLLVEIRANQFVHNEIIDLQIFVVEDYSDINNLEQAQGTPLLTGGATLNDVSPKRMVDYLRTTYLDKSLTLRLYDKTLGDTVQLQAEWMGHGTKIITMNAPTYPNNKPVALLSEVNGEEQFITVRLNDGFSDIESAPESLHFLLEQGFGPLPLPIAP